MLTKYKSDINNYAFWFNPETSASRSLRYNLWTAILSSVEQEIPSFSHYINIHILSISKTLPSSTKSGRHYIFYLLKIINILLWIQFGSIRCKHHIRRHNMNNVALILIKKNFFCFWQMQQAITWD